MIPSQSSRAWEPSRFPQQRGFTLVELLTAMVVFCVLIFLVMQLMNLAQGTSEQTKRRIDVGEEARFAMDRIGEDLRQAVIRRDVDFRVTPVAGDSDLMAFMARVPSYDSSRKLALIAYRVSNRGLERAALSLDESRMVFLPAPLTAIDGAGDTFVEILPDSDFDLVSPGVIRAEFLLIGKDGHVLPSGAEIDHARGVLAVAAVLSTQARGLLTDTEAATLAGKFADLPVPNPPQNPPQNPAGAWIETVEAESFQSQPLPKRALKEIRVVQRFFPFAP